MKLVSIHYRRRLTALEIVHGDRSCPMSWVQTEPTWIVIGWRSTAMFNVELEEWFRVSNRAHPEAFRRPGTEVYPMSFRRLAANVGFWRAALECFEVACGFRVIGRILDWRKPVSADMSEFEPPRIRE